ncbi:hypothetical protein B9Z19DRAFT_1069342 [Tuber borchii]|uniref:Uncharacterized protein n=1 Tax=Tuber borchii TaxID=42251 RepID=A0A2T6ZBW1_TUBBO|nr:hypothetical protein B9Z19DRAFT_1069342 [Tuber borchii]
MTNELDPHHLLALMEFTFAKKQDGASRPLRGPLPRDPNSDVRVGLQLDSQRQEIRLTIAANQTVKDDLVSHLTTVWGKLQALSNTYAEQRQRSSGPDLDGRLSPEIPGDVAAPLKLELIQLRGEEDLQGIERNLFKIVVGTQLKDLEWETIYCQSLWVIENATPVLAGSNNWEIFGQGLGVVRVRGMSEWLVKSSIRVFTVGNSEVPRQISLIQVNTLRPILEKITFLTRHISSLISFAHSPRLRMSISTVPGQARTIKLPTSQEKW